MKSLYNIPKKKIINDYDNIPKKKIINDYDNLSKEIILNDYDNIPKKKRLNDYDNIPKKKLINDYDNIPKKKLLNDYDYEKTESKFAQVKNSDISTKIPYIADEPIAVVFKSIDQTINYPVAGYNFDNFSKLENKLFNEFPDLKNKNIFYISNGIIIDKSSSLKDNKIKNGTNILIYYN